MFHSMCCGVYDASIALILQVSKPAVQNARGLVSGSCFRYFLLSFSKICLCRILLFILFLACLMLLSFNTRFTLFELTYD